MDVLLSYTEAAYAADPLAMLQRFFGLIMFFAATNLLWAANDIIPLAGSRGLTPMVGRVKTWKQQFPLAARLKFSPANWNPLGWSNSVLQLWPVVGAIAAGFASLQFFMPSLFEGTAPILLTVSTATVWYVHLVTTEICFMAWPWHGLISECLFMTALSTSPALFIGSRPGIAPAAVLSLTSTTSSLFIRFLAFRIMFGFGKLKFVGSSIKDRMYVKAFLPGMPIPSICGWYIYNYTPRVMFLFGYVFFFLSEIIVPFFFFSPVVWHRVAAMLLTIKLMFGIQLSGNFGNFNMLTGSLAVVLPLPVFGFDSIAAQTALLGDGGQLAAGVALAVKCITVFLMITALPLLAAFNSWVQLSWFNWPALRVSAKPVAVVCAYYELVAIWRIQHPFGVFPPKTGAPMRAMYLFEGSADGVTYKPYRYKFQPTSATEAPAFIPGIHPMWDFVIFYQIMPSMFMRTVAQMTTPVSNGLARNVDTMARNLLEGGDACKLFRECPFPQSRPPKFIRVVQVNLRPVTPGEKEFGSAAYWHVERGQLELAPVTLDTLHKLPNQDVADVHKTLDYAHRVWRQRANGAQPVTDFWDRSNKAAVNAQVHSVVEDLKVWLAKRDRKHQAAIDHIIADSQGVTNLAIAVAKHDARLRGGKEVHEAEEAAMMDINGAACRAMDRLVGLGWPYSGQHPAPNEKRLPTSAFQTYAFSLWMIAGGSKRLESLTPENMTETLLEFTKYEGNQKFRMDSDGSEVHDGVALFATMYARTLRLEASQLRRFLESGNLRREGMDSFDADVVVPGYAMFWRSCFLQQIRFKFDSESQGDWGKEHRPRFVFNEDTCMFDFTGTTIE